MGLVECCERLLSWKKEVWKEGKIVLFRAKKAQNKVKWPTFRTFSRPTRVDYIGLNKRQKARFIQNPAFCWLASVRI
jgi:hypothetical protein